MTSGAGFDVFALTAGLFGGLALFLYGVDKMSNALKSVAGDRLRAILRGLTANRFTGVFSGIIVTTLVQSSTVTTVLVVGFVSAGLMSFPQSIAVIMGANVGTTITAQLIAFNITAAALPMIAVGFGAAFFSKNRTVQSYGAMVMGMGMLFYGMHLMSQAMVPMRDHGPFLDLMARLDNPLLGILAGAAFTALVQASAATTGAAIALAAQGLISLPAGIALILGANIGTCVTAALAAVGRPREAVRAAAVHVVFNVGGVLVWLPFIGVLAEWVVWITPGGLDAPGTPRQIANAHTIFNVVNTIVCLAFIGLFAKLVLWIFPDRAGDETKAPEPAAPRHLREELLVTPPLALEAVRLELGEMGRRVRDMLDAALPATLTGDEASLERVAAMDADIDALHGHIVEYLRRIGLDSLSESQTRRYMNLMEVANSLEHIGDIMETDMVTIGRRRLAESFTIGAETARRLKALHDQTALAVDLAVDAVVRSDAEQAAEVVAMKGMVTALADTTAAHVTRRLLASEPNRRAVYAREMETVEKLKRIYYFAKRIAKATDPQEPPAPEIVPEEGAPEQEERRDGVATPP